MYLVETLDLSLLEEDFDISKFLDKVKGVQSLIDRGGTEGEKDAARSVMQRLVLRANEEKKNMSASMASEFQARFDRMRNSASSAEQSTARKTWKPYDNTPPKPEPKPKSRSQDEADAEWARKQEEKARRDREYDRREQDGWQGSQRSRQSQNDEDLSPFKVYNYAEYQDGSSDKVYGVARYLLHTGEARYFTFWGRNGATLSTKEFSSLSAANLVFLTKIRKGYRERAINPSIEAYVRRAAKL